MEKKRNLEFFLCCGVVLEKRIVLRIIFGDMVSLRRVQTFHLKSFASLLLGGGVFAPGQAFALGQALAPFEALPFGVGGSGGGATGDISGAVCRAFEVVVTSQDRVSRDQARPT